ncbi:hypothetical protein [Chamaesiphon polymorphus]|uniref:DUF304 domain-containing protein n=1 Tax=Chamaesiphon polymorphus CCALA 037 TaxID=2107692 RepID=A0A2T1FPA1_9CYAN|nr:hypothetical protein [Chamaesiphon polymorphus]PSB46795.1 hypothetical protein C7B77_24610 [Chamaesiphon polymorphus CCALA 037]
MNLIQDKLNDLWILFIRQVSAQIGFRVTDTEPNKLILEADSSIPARGTGLWLILLILMPFYSDLLVDPNDPGIFNGYDFYNHSGSIPWRICLALPGLWVFFVYGKFTRCVFDKNNNTFVLTQKVKLLPQKTEGDLQGIAAIDIFPIEKPSWMIFGKETFTHIQVNLIQHSGEIVSFIFMERKSEIDNVVRKYRNMLCEFLNLPA